MNRLDEAGDVDSAALEIGGRSLNLSNLKKVLWPEAGFTKRQMVAYYAAVSDAIVSYLRNRPLTLKRYPDGVNGWYWFQTRCPHPPPWMPTIRVRKAGGENEYFDYCMVDDAASLLWVANLGAIELHPLLSRGDRLDEATVVVFDLDPGPPATVIDCCDIALLLRALLDDLRLASYAKTSGALGLHVYVPLNAPHSYGLTRNFARGVAETLLHREGARIAVRKERTGRRGKVLVDWAQNSRLRSMVAPYSLRAMPFPTVSTPVDWDEIDAAARSRIPEDLLFTARDAVARLEHHGDLFRDVLTIVQRLPRA